MAPHNFGFPSELRFATGKIPVSVVAAHLNRDPHLDLATVNSYSNKVSVLLGKGDGTFAPPVSFGAGVDPRSLVAADLDGDGDLVLFNDGDGTFNAAVDYPAGHVEYSLTTGDFDGDGDLDLVAGNTSQLSLIERR